MNSTEFFTTLEAELGAQVDAATESDAGSLTVEIHALDGTDLEALPEPVRHLLEMTSTDDRSRYAFMLAAAAVRHGLDNDLTAAVLAASPIVRDKYGTRLDAEVGRVVGKVRATVEPLPSAVPVNLPALDDPDANPYRASLIDWPTLWTRERLEEWLIEPVLARGRIHAFYAKHKTGKSLLMLWLAVQAAVGALALRQSEGRPVPTLYVDMEMTEDDVQDRLVAMGVGPDTDLSALHYALLPAAAPLTTRAGGRELYEICADLGIEHLVIDTVSRVIDAEENSNDTFRDLYRYAMAPLKRAGVTISRLDHTGHQGDHQRGASAKGDDPDVLWSVTRTATGYALKSTARMDWIPQRVDLALEADPLGFTEVARGYSSKAHEIAGKLDELGVPIDAGERAARSRAKDQGTPLGKGTEVRDALVLRRQRPNLTILPGGEL